MTEETESQSLLTPEQAAHNERLIQLWRMRDVIKEKISNIYKSGVIGPNTSLVEAFPQYHGLELSVTWEGIVVTVPDELLSDWDEQKIESILSHIAQFGGYSITWGEKLFTTKPRPVERRNQ